MTERLSADEHRAVARRLRDEWKAGRSKSRIERDEWGDASSHGRRFDHYVRRWLGEETKRKSKQTERVERLEKLLRSHAIPPDDEQALAEWERQLLKAREAALAAVRVWNDPTAGFRTETFALLLVTAWNSLCIALLMRDGGEWRELADDGTPVLHGGREKAADTRTLVGAAFPEHEKRPLRENVTYWVDLRNQVAHRHLPALDTVVIPQAQAALLNLENALQERFGGEYVLGERLSVPLQLSGFRDPGVLSSLKRLQAALPLDVQDFLNRKARLPDEILASPEYALRVAFVPVVHNSGRSPDAVAYFLKPGEVPEDLVDTIQQIAVLTKFVRPRSPANIRASEVWKEVESRIPFRFNSDRHTRATRFFNIKAIGDATDKTKTDLRYCEWSRVGNNYGYTREWIELLVRELATVEGFERVVGKLAQPKQPGSTR